MVEVNFPSNRPVVLIFGDRKGSKQIDGWSSPIFKRYNGRINMYGIASVGGVPTIAQGIVRRLIRQQTQFPVLMDWSGSVTANFDYPKEKALVVVVARNGTVLLRRSGPSTPTELSEIYTEIDKQLR